MEIFASDSAKSILTSMDEDHPIMGKAIDPIKVIMIDAIDEPDLKLYEMIGNVKLGAQAALFVTRTNLDEFFDDTEEFVSTKLIDNFEGFISEAPSIFGKASHLESSVC